MIEGRELSMEFLAAYIDDVELHVVAGFADQEIQAAPCGFESLKVGVMEDLSKARREFGIEHRKELRLLRRGRRHFRSGDGLPQEPFYNG
jgi:hypothetical protein